MKELIVSTEFSKKSWKYYFQYYCNVNHRTIQGRMTIGFISIAILAIILVLSIHWQWQASMRKSTYSLTTASATRLYAHQFRVLSDELVDTWKENHSLQDHSIQVVEKTQGDPWVKMQIARDTMDKLSVLWKSDADRKIYADILQSMTTLKAALQWNTDSLSIAQMVLKDEIEPARQNIGKHVLALAKVYSGHIDESRTHIIETEGRLNWLIPLYTFLAFIAACFIGFFMILGVMRRIRSIRRYLTEISKGNLPEKMQESEDEMNSIIREVNSLIDNLRDIQSFALYVGKGDFEKNIKVFNDEGDLGVSLSQMRMELKKVSEEERQRSWANEGFAHFSDILRSSINTTELADRIIQQMVKYLHVNQGGLFVLEKEGTANGHMALRACYAYNRKKYLDQTISMGQGLVGQAWAEAETIYLRQIPADYLRITSGLGEASPRFLLIIPLKLENKVEGVIELASFRDFLPHEIQFAEKVAESIASTFANSRIVEHTSHLLNESQTMSELLKAQEEEVRQNMEELAATQEEMSRTHYAMARRQEELEICLLEVEREKAALEKVVQELQAQLSVYQGSEAYKS